MLIKFQEKERKLNEADGMIFQTETQLKELGEKLSDDHKVAVEYALTELRNLKIFLQFKLP
jgi:molecular chaperone DnaK